jgi:hypothetical protein
MYIRGLSRVSTHLSRYNAGHSSIRSKVCYEKISKRYISLTQQSFKNEEKLVIGGVSRKLTESKYVELIPSKYGKLSIGIIIDDTYKCNLVKD